LTQPERSNIDQNCRLLPDEVFGVTAMNVPVVGAFFDFDKTLLETESAKLGLKYLWDRRLLSRRFLIKVLVINFFYQRHLVSDEFVARIILGIYRGRRLREFAQGAQAFYQEVLKPRLAPNILAKVRRHRRQGHLLVLISGSVRYMLQSVVEDIGFDHLLCTDLEVGEDGLLTGRARGPLCIDRTKRALAIELAKAHRIDLSRSYAYGNHQSDIPLLELVGHPFVVEPTKPLRRVAQKRNWPVLGFR
jgi:HAD superfamily hydrolase (TIGR01490 family)